MNAGSIVVTGATGFVGRHVVADLLTRGFSVTAIVRDHTAELPDAVKRVVVPRWDAANAIEMVGQAVAEAAGVVHLAGRAHQIRESLENPLPAYRHAHVDTARVLLRALAGSAARRLVVLSTVAAAVTNAEDPVDDSVDAAPSSPYGISKREMELLILEEAQRVGVAPVILRAPMVYGPSMKGNPLRLMQLISRGRPIPVSSPSARRSVIYVGNLVHAIGRGLDHPDIGSGPYFVSDGPAPTVSEFVQEMAAALGVRARIVRLPKSALKIVGRLGDVLARAMPFPITSYEMNRLTGSVQVDGSRFWKIVGETPPYEMSDGMRAAAEWFRSQESSR